MSSKIELICSFVTSAPPGITPYTISRIGEITPLFPIAPEHFGEIPPFVQYAGDLNPITLNVIEDYVGLAEHGPQAGRDFVARPPHERLSCETVPGLSDFEKNPVGDFG
jgi:hypothetical protein